MSEAALRPATGSRRFPWRHIAAASVLLLELTLIVPWMGLIAGAHTGSQLIALLVWMLAFSWSARLLLQWVHEYRLRREVSLGLSAAGLLLGLLLTINLLFNPGRLLDLAGALRQLARALPQIYPLAPELPLVLLVVIIWRRGVASASPDFLEPARTGFKFRFGVLVYALLMVLPLPGEGKTVLLIAFFLASLMGMSLTRADRLSRLRGAAEPPFGGQWFASLLVLFGLTIGTGLGLAALLGSALAYRSLESIRSGLVRGLALLYALLLPLFRLLDPLIGRLMAGLRNFFSSVPGLAQPEDLPPPGTGEPVEGIQPPPLFQWINDLLSSLAPIWPYLRLALVIAVVSLLVWSAIRLVRRRESWRWERTLAMDEGLSLDPRFRGSGLGNRLRNLGQDLRGLGSALLAGQLRTAVIIRHIYAQLLDAAAISGRARHHWETPREFQRALVHLFPDARLPIERLTEAYQTVRYGHLPETEDLVAKVRSDWASIKSEMARH
jgi:hypothetical protein